MKKLFVCVSVVGLAAGVVYWLYKKGKADCAVPKRVDEKVVFEPEVQEEDVFERVNAVEEMKQEKSASVQAVSERHAEAAAIMKDAYCGIMEDFIQDYSEEKVENEKEIVIDEKSTAVMKEMDAISDELDDLLM